MFEDDENEMENAAALQEVADSFMIDQKRLKKIFVHLEDKDGDEVAIKDIMDNLAQYIEDQLRSVDNNATASQVYPLMAEGMTIALPRALGGDKYGASLLLSQEHFRHAFLQEMTLGFYLSKFMEKNGLRIVTQEEDITQEEVDRIKRLNKAASVTAIAHLVGANGKDVIKELVKRGVITKEDLESQGVEVDELSETKDDDDDNSN
jgi:vacuolar-type H+-ATPase subunit F/Vma7